jgi:hypothetical protein
MVQMVALVDRLQRENRDLAGQLGFLSAQLLAAEGKIKALTTPQQPLEDPGEPEPVKRPPIPAEPFPMPIEPSRNAAPWWRSWLSWLATGVVM